MIDIDRTPDLAAYITGCLPNDYLITREDVAWLEECGTFLQGSLTAANILQATKDAVEKHGCSMHIDPYELIIDAGICDAELHLK